MPLIRTTLEPWKEVEVSDREAASLARQGLIYTGAPVPPPPTYAEGVWEIIRPFVEEIIGEGGGGGGTGADGKSAYELAVAAGFVGTLAQWLASLKGEDGEDGTDGAPGPGGRVDVYHGSNAAFPRPDTGGRPATWIGTVVPTNRIAGDLYYLTGEPVVDPGGPTFSGAFDTFEAPHRAVSLRRLLTSYTGPLVRVRRSSDNTEQDIAAKADGDLDTDALLAFAGSGSAYVVTWYDQSGNGRHFSQADTAAQPRIVNAGAVETTNGKPAVAFDGATNYLLSATAGLYAAGAATMAAVMAAAAASNSVVLAESATGNNVGIYRLMRSSTANWNVQSSGNTGTSNYASSSSGNDVFDGLQHQAFYVDSANVINTWKDGAAKHVNLAAPRTSPPTVAQTSVGAHKGSSTPANFLNGKVQEIVTWASDRTADRAAIASAQKTYYGTP